MLEFRIVADTKHDHAAVEKAKAPDGLKNPPQGYRWVGVDERFRLDLREGDIVREEAQSDGKLRKHLFVKLDPFNLTEKDIALVTEIKDERQFPAIGLRFKPDGAQRFGELTRAHLPEEIGLFKYKLAIIIDGVAVSDPMINSIIREGAMIEMGNQIQPEEFTELVKRISRGGGNRGVEKGSP